MLKTTVRLRRRSSLSIFNIRDKTRCSHSATTPSCSSIGVQSRSADDLRSQGSECVQEGFCRWLWVCCVRENYLVPHRSRDNIVHVLKLALVWILGDRQDVVHYSIELLGEKFVAANSVDIIVGEQRSTLRRWISNNVCLDNLSPDHEWYRDANEEESENTTMSFVQIKAQVMVKTAAWWRWSSTVGVFFIAAPLLIQVSTVERRKKMNSSVGWLRSRQWSRQNSDRISHLQCMTYALCYSSLSS